MFDSVSISENGRDGSVRYSRGLRHITGYWCFGGADVVAIVSMGSREEWRHDHAWALDERPAILQRVAAEVVRQRAPTCVAEIDEASGDILLRAAGAGGAGAVARTDAVTGGPTAQARAASFVHRHARIRSMFGLGALFVVLIAAGVLWMGRKMLMVAPAHGVPLNASLRTDRHIATLIQYTDPHLPRVTGRGGDDTTSLSILVIPLDGSAPRLVPVASKLSPNSYSLARILGSDGRTLWFDATGLFGVRLDDYELVTTEDLRAANPSLDRRWWDDARGMDIIDGRLHIVNDDRSAAVDVDPRTWKASDTPPKVRKGRFDRIEPGDYMAAGFLSGPQSWFGLHSGEEIRGEFAPGEWVRPAEAAVDAKQARRLYVADAEASSDGTHSRLRTLRALSEAQYLNAALLRPAIGAAPLRLSDPDSVLMAYTSAPGLNGTLVVARVDLQGHAAWTVDTGLDRFLLEQVLPGPDVYAFVGTRPPIPDKLSEPLVVLVDTETGAITSHSLWR